MCTELDRNMTEAEIRTSIKQLKTGKSGGPNEMINESLNDTNTLVPYLQRLFNMLFEIGHFLNCSSDGYIALIHKERKFT